MIHILARIRAALLGLVKHTRQEPGCKLGTLFQREDEPTVFMTVEQWLDQASADAHLRSAHIAAAMVQAGPHLAAAPEIHQYTALA
ncbi:MAG: putative quinol monooxygenase [Thiomonas sp.]|uniref:ABM domain-containing protein n=1 Tax=mine drainage metagenome TaxID=410659 RepID=E6PNB4_9ZZZZ